MTSLLRFLKKEDGPTTVEYAVMLALILLTIIGSFKLLVVRTGDTFDQCGTELNNAGF